MQSLLTVALSQRDEAQNLTQSCAANNVSDNVPVQILAWILVFGALASYIPQIIKIWKTGTEGLSAIYVLLTAFSGLCLLQAKFFDNFIVFSCCHIWKGSTCVRNLVPLGQFVSVFVGQFAVLIAYAIKQTEDVKKTRIAFAVIVLSFVIFALAGGLLLRYNPENVRDFGIVLGVFNISTGIVLFVPQIRLLYRNKSSGALSVITLSIQTIGLMFFSISSILSTRDAAHPYGEYGVYIPQIITMLLSAFMLSMCLYYDLILPRKNRKLGLKEAFDSDGYETEMTEAKNLLIEDDDFFDDDF
jgi:uncharacterized protein with PQ loop repeat